MGSRARRPALLSASCLALAGLAAAPETKPADLILTGGFVYTMDATRSAAEAVAVRGGRIVYVGTPSGAEALRGSATRVADLSGRMLLPGFHDAHVHPVSGGMELAQCNLNGLKTKEEIFAAIRRYAESHPKDPWILGGGWDLPIFPAANPSRQELDAIVSDRPALISASDGHSTWANTKALELARVTRETPDPPNGRIERDSAGNPSGTLRETAGGLVEKIVPEPTAAEYDEGLRRGLEMARRFGITSLIEANAGQEILSAYGRAEKSEGGLPARILVSLSVNTSKGPEQVAELSRRRSAFTRGHLRASAAKIFADGVIEANTAALLEPYLDKPGDRGKARLEPEAFAKLATALDREKFQIHVHAIGDRAVRMSLDALEAARRANGPRDARPLLAHIELIDPRDIPRFRRLGVVADFQPLWAWADPYIVELTIPKLGPERSRWIYPIGSVAAAGAVVAGGSDWSVSSMNPLDAIETAVTRRELGASGAAFLPEERISLPEALAAYTIAGAYAAFEEKETGSIEVGKAADLIVLDRNLFEVPPEKIHEAKVLWTLLEGREIWREPSFRAGK
jgi:hypothetical protein